MGSIHQGGQTNAEEQDEEPHHPVRCRVRPEGDAIDDLPYKGHPHQGSDETDDGKKHRMAHILAFVISDIPPLIDHTVSPSFRPLPTFPSRSFFARKKNPSPATCRTTIMKIMAGRDTM